MEQIEIEEKIATLKVEKQVAEDAVRPYRLGHKRDLKTYKELETVVDSIEAQILSLSLQRLKLMPVVTMSAEDVRKQNEETQAARAKAEADAAREKAEADAKSAAEIKARVEREIEENNSKVVAEMEEKVKEEKAIDEKIKSEVAVEVPEAVVDEQFLIDKQKEKQKREYYIAKGKAAEAAEELARIEAEEKNFERVKEVKVEEPKAEEPKAEEPKIEETPAEEPKVIDKPLD